MSQDKEHEGASCLPCKKQRKDASCECCDAAATTPCLSNVPMRSTSSLSRLIAWCACFVIVTCSCYHKSAGVCTTSGWNTAWELIILFPSNVPLWILHLVPWETQQFQIQNLGHDSHSWDESRMKWCLHHSPR